MAKEKKANWFKRAFGRIARYFRELKSELKKVVWPTPKQVVKNTLIVFACVLVVLAVVFVFDLVSQFGVNTLIDATVDLAVKK